RKTALRTRSALSLLPLAGALKCSIGRVWPCLAAFGQRMPAKHIGTLGILAKICRILAGMRGMLLTVSALYAWAVSSGHGDHLGIRCRVPLQFRQSSHCLDPERACQSKLSRCFVLMCCGRTWPR